MRRREFIEEWRAQWDGVGSPRAAGHATPRGVVAGFSESEMRPPLMAFRSKLSQLGWSEGRNLAVDARLGAGTTSE